MTTTRRLVCAAALGFSVAGVPAADAHLGSQLGGQPAPQPAGPAKPGSAPAKPASPPPKSNLPDPPPPPGPPKVRVANRRGQILPEGAFLVSRRGELVADTSAAKWGGWSFHFDPDARGGAEAPMILMPCSRLDAMQRLAQVRSAGIEYTVSGQVFVYQGQNYLLPVFDEARAAALTAQPAEPEHASEDDTKAPDAPSAPPPSPPAPAPAPGSPEEEVQRRLRALDSVTHDRRRIPTPAAPAAAPGAESPASDVGAMRTPPKRGGLVAEGTYLASRRGRLIRESAGQWVMRFDADARGQVDPPMLVLPCMNLEAMERVAALRGDAVSFIVSGQVYVFGDENYFLPALYRVDSVNPDLLPPRQ